MKYKNKQYIFNLLYCLAQFLQIATIITSIDKQGGSDMIRFDRLWKTMEYKGVSTYQLREQCGIDSKTICRLKANDNMETKTLNKLCSALNCRLEDIAEYIPD